MRFLYTLFTLLTFCIISNIGYSQFDSTYSDFREARLQYVSGLDFRYDSISWWNLDTSIVSIRKEGTLTLGDRLNTGNVGSAESSLIFENRTSELFFGSNAFSNNLYLNSNVRYHNVSVPITRVTFFAGAKKEQGASFTHTQNVMKPLNVGVDFERYSSEGFYINQKTLKSSFRINANYISENRRYRAFANWNLNIGENEENGGLANDSVFYENSEDSRFSIPVNLTDARNEYDIREFAVTQSFNIFKKAEHDSVLTKDRKIIGQVFLSNLLRWNFNRFVDQNSDSVFYSQFLTYDSLSYEDAVKSIRFENSLGYQLKLIEGLNPVVALNYHMSDYKDDGFDTSFVELGYEFILPKVTVKRNYFTANVRGGIDGYNSDLFSLGIGVGRHFNDNISLDIEYKQESSLPDFNYLHYNSDNGYLTWDNQNFKNEEHRKFKLNLEFKKQNLRFSVSNSTIDNFTYIGDDLQPSQLESSSLSITTIELKKVINLDPVHFELLGYYQLLDENSVLELPEFVTMSSVYYQNQLFKNAMTVRLGGRVRYYSGYYGQGYFPLSRQFYYQNSVETGDYPYVDLFLKAKIKRAQIFVELSNAGQDLFDYNYVMIPGYPQRDRNLRFGVQWDFMN